MGAAITIQRRVQWMDTDAAGIWHHTTLTRWVEEAEAELHRRAGIIEHTFGATPRVKLEYEFHLPLRFDDEVDVTLTVDRLGESSIEYLVEVDKDGDLAAAGRMVAVLIDRDTGQKRSWPDEMRRALSAG